MRVWDVLRVLVVAAAVIFCPTLSQRIDKVTCERRPSHTSATPREGDNGFSIKVLGLPCRGSYHPGETYAVVLNGTYRDQKLQDFMMVAAPEGSEDNFRGLGTWQHPNTRASKFDDHCTSIVTGYDYHPSFTMSSAELLWTAPPTGSGCVEFRAAVVEMRDIWYRDEGGLTFKVCEKDPSEACSASSTSTPRGNDPDTCTSCCACGAPKYEVTFKGNWSEDTHPKDYPKGSAASLLHWSDILGASHTCSYTMWDYGMQASGGVKNMCEFGYPFKLRDEIRSEGNKAKSVVRMPGVWGARALNSEARTSTLTVDRAHPLFSLITMVGPSPDWCVGVSKLNLCSGCSWVEGATIDLYPWDAGTDSGVTYMSPNSPTWPREPIHQLTNRVPDLSSSPFHGEEPVRPMATVTLRRLTPASETECAPGGDDPAASRGSEGEGTDGANGPTLTKCMTSPWGEFGSCSVTCGLGTRSRRRMFKHPMGSKVMCPQVALTDTETCLGLTNTCEGGTGAEDVCAMLPWSDWSPCSAPCDSVEIKGEKVRTRAYLNASSQAICSNVLMEKKACSSRDSDCAVTRGGRTGKGSRRGSSKSTASVPTPSGAGADLCLLPSFTGVCRGYQPRWFYDSTLGRCEMFIYGGCLGNDNRFDTKEDCMARCGQSQSGPLKPICKLPMSKGMFKCEKRMPSYWYNMDTGVCERFVYTGCGGNANRFASLKECMQMCGAGSGPVSGTEDMNPEAMPLACKQPSVTGPCFAAMRKWYFDMRTMKCAKFVYGGCQGNDNRWDSEAECEKMCPVAKAMMPSKVTPTSAVPRPVDCMMSPWMDWGDCSVACGVGKQRRERMVKREPAHGGLECGERKEHRKCMMPPCEARSTTPPPQDCQLSPWTDWTSCETEVGACDKEIAARFSPTGLFLNPGGHVTTVGAQSRVRIITRFAAYGGAACSTNVHEMRACNVVCPLPQSINLLVTDSLSSFTAENKEDKPTACVMSEWEGWSSCSRTCGKGKKMRRRTVLEEGTKPCPKLKQVARCTKAKCPKSLNDCKMTKWSAWSTCSSVCSGTQHRTRSIKRPQKPGGRPCKHEREERQCSSKKLCGKQ